ncbi:MAG: 50S ribosomal protein L17 [Candidatus Marinimicrobia bacterium]|nr:50S ribosomal protein L17 [Candidatus Neomarinimicrobiota bacterium]
MRHRKKGAKLGRSVSHRKALLRNLSKELIKNGKIKTTHPKAKALRPYIEKLITLGRKDTVHARRQAYKKLGDRKLIQILFDHIAPQYIDRNGGYTRIIKLGYRENDSAPLSYIEFVDYEYPEEEEA